MIDQGDFVTQHLLSSRGSGRWQFWDAAVDQWRQAPLWGDGAGSYESWWAENGSIGLFVKDAHPCISKCSVSSESSASSSFWLLSASASASASSARSALRATSGYRSPR